MNVPMLLLHLLAAAMLIVLACLGVLLVKLSRLSRQGLDRALRDEQRLARDEASREAQALRGEIARQQKDAHELLTATLHRMGSDQRDRLEGMARQTAEGHGRLIETVGAVIEKTFFIDVCPSVARGSGFRQPLRTALRLHPPFSLEGLPTFDQIVRDILIPAP